MSTEENKVVVRRFCDAFSNHDYDVLREIMAPDLAERWITTYIPSADASFENHRVEITDMMAEGDKVWARLASSGRHVGEWMGLPPTGRKWTNTGILFCRVVNGKIVDIPSLWDVRNHIKQLGGAIKPAGQ